MKSKKVQLTYALTSNADGSEKLPPMIIGKAQKPHAFQKKTGTQLGRHILLLQDTFSGHKPPDGLTNIRVENFEPNLTAHIQPMDQGIIQASKLITTLPSYSAQLTNMTPGQHHQKSTTLTNLKPCTLLNMLGAKSTHLQSSIAGRRLGFSQR